MGKYTWREPDKVVLSTEYSLRLSGYFTVNQAGLRLSMLYNTLINIIQYNDLNNTENTA